MAAYGMIVYLIYQNRHCNKLLTRHIFHYPNLLARDLDKNNIVFAASGREGMGTHGVSALPVSALPVSAGMGGYWAPTE